MRFYPEELQRLSKALEEKGGKAFLVGGAVRDFLFKRPLEQIKDWDVEIFGLSIDDIWTIARTFGKVNIVGKRFGILKLKTSENEFDLSVPRRENKVGKGHKGFDVEPDPSMSIEEAASRRDFTINAISLNLSNGVIADPYNGQLDIDTRTLRHVGSKFGEDPLRVLRGMQFVGRFELHATNETIRLCAGLLDEYEDLPAERVWDEWKKWATKSTTPSMGLEFLKKVLWIQHYPALDALINTRQDPGWHPEGTVWEHTKYTVNHAAHLSRVESLDDFDRNVLVFAALCHDLGKPNTTVDDDGLLLGSRPSKGRIRSPGHDVVGVVLTELFLESIGCPSSISKKVVPLVKHHLAHLQTSTPKAVRRLSKNLGAATMGELSRLIECDHSGRPPLKGGMPANALEMLALAEELAVMEAKPPMVLTGKLLLKHELVKAGPEMGKLLNAGYEAQLDGKFDSPEKALKWAKKHLASVS